MCCGKVEVAEVEESGMVHGCFDCNTTALKYSSNILQSMTALQYWDIK